MERIGASFTLPEWLSHRRMSRADWYRRKSQNGNLPATYGRGRGQRISPEADAEFLRREAELASREDAA
jgi:hypothetical protein